MATKNKSICLLLFLTAAMADAAPKFEPARFADSEMAPASLIEFPRSKKNVDVTIRCDNVLSVEASIDRIFCYGTNRRKMSYKDAIIDVIKDFEFVPAHIDGEVKAVVIQFSVRFVREDGVEGISVYQNHGLNADKYGNNYTGVQRYDWDHWSSIGCRHHYRRFIVSASATIGSDGALMDHKISKGKHYLGICEEDLNSHMSSGSYIPAMSDGVPVEARYVETYLNYWDPEASY